MCKRWAPVKNAFQSPYFRDFSPPTYMWALWTLYHFIFPINVIFLRKYQRIAPWSCPFNALFYSALPVRVLLNQPIDRKSVV